MPPDAALCCSKSLGRLMITDFARSAKASEQQNDVASALGVWNPTLSNG